MHSTRKKKSETAAKDIARAHAFWCLTKIYTSYISATRRYNDSATLFKSPNVFIKFVTNVVTKETKEAGCDNGTKKKTSRNLCLRRIPKTHFHYYAQNCSPP